MQKPILYVFNISHYCEKALWALEYFGIDHEVRPVMVGTHRRIAKKLGASSGSVPFLQVGDRVVAGSAAIIDWCEAQTTANPVSLQGDDAGQVRAIEKRLDDIAGVHVRRFYYSDALINAPKSVRPLFSNGLPLWQRAAVTLAWSQIVQLMVKVMDLGPEQGLESRAIVDRELAWLDDLLADGRPYLTGDHWTRADLTAASLLAPLVVPEEHPVYTALEVPQTLASAMQAWADRPILHFVRRAYTAHR